MQPRLHRGEKLSEILPLFQQLWALHGQDNAAARMKVELDIEFSKSGR
jgi:hypothetical protein